MNRAGLVMIREYLENVRTKGFWFGILMMPVTLVLVGVTPMLIDSTRDAQRYAVIDRAGVLPGVDALIDETDFHRFLTRFDDRSLARVPTDLATFLPEIRALDDAMVRDIATALINGTLPDLTGLPRRLQAFLTTKGPSVRDWWQGLDPETKAGLAPGLSVNAYRRIQAEDPQSMNQQLLDGDLFAYFVIESGLIEDGSDATYVSTNLTDKALLVWFGDQLSRYVREQRLRQRSIDAETAEWVNEPMTFDEVTMGDEGARAVNTNDIARQWAPVAFVFFLWMAILINTQLLLTNTIEEKSNKLIEVLLSSITPMELMAGKILGIAATGLTIIACWAVIFVLFFIGLPGLMDAQMPVDLPSIFGDGRTLLLFLMYFVLGYLLYAAMLVGLGSLCNNLKDAQNLIMPVQMIQLIPMLMLVPIAQDPNGKLAVVLSYIPPLTPFVMMNRTAGQPSDMEYLLTTLLLVVSIVVAFWFAAKLFRIGILMTGKPPGLREIGRLLRAPVGSY